MTNAIAQTSPPEPALRPTGVRSKPAATSGAADRSGKRPVAPADTLVRASPAAATLRRELTVKARAKSSIPH